MFEIHPEPGIIMTDELTAQLGTLIAEKILKQPGRVIQPDQALISSGLIDSFSLVDLALLVEDNFGVRVEDTELNAESFDTLTQLADLIHRKQG
jgi:acyl carrier protein